MIELSVSDSCHLSVLMTLFPKLQKIGLGQVRTRSFAEICILTLSTRSEIKSKE